MTICALDVETTGLDSKKDRVTELGVVFFNTEDWASVNTYQSLLWDKSYPPLTAEITKITGITQDMLTSEGRSPESVWSIFKDMFSTYKVDAVVAHNADFDKSFVAEELKRHELAPIAVPWVCSMKDIKHTVGTCRKLSHLALDYGLAVDPKVLHRAKDDVELMIRMLKEAVSDFPTLLKRSLLKNLVVRAVVPSPFGAGSDGGVGKDKAKACGFSWDGARKIWVKTIKEDELEQTERELGYKLTVISG